MSVAGEPLVAGDDKNSPDQNSAVDAAAWIAAGDSGGQEQLLNDNYFAFDMDHEFILGGNCAGDGVYDLVLDPNLGLIEPVPADDPMSLCQLERGKLQDIKTVSNSEITLDSLSSVHTPQLSPSSTTDSSDGLPRSSCECLQELARLLYQLEGRRYSYGQDSLGVSVDALLGGVQSAEKAWKGLMNCTSHKMQNNDKAALLLFATSIRKVVNSIISPPSSPVDNDPSAEISVSIGKFKLTGEAKAEVVVIASARALQDILLALQHLWRHIRRPDIGTATELDGTGLRIQTLMRSLVVNQRLVTPSNAKSNIHASIESMIALLDALQQSIELLET
ncbi:hypothetical protein NOR_07387 [Metarhizium rileyi]|uniref:Aflatoxin regulatory protein domain-containing protein n=1 Tax=Metarhizium rileyi (strain RCEF 4871) TaxID=1649241 RepID=A0A166YG21_METRR|nr:hypothetical protein NOR_07387 [Metarhizium rileyi RCEF 4871]